MWEQTSGTYLCGVNKKKLGEEVPIWRLCFMVSQGRKYTFGKFQENMVWSIQGTTLLAQ
jgi:hypothetical protein